MQELREGKHNLYFTSTSSLKPKSSAF